MGESAWTKEHDGERFWGFVDIAGRRPEKIEDELEYDTATRGKRVRPEARPAGEGIYCIVEHGNHNHLIYALELPKERGPVQHELNDPELLDYEGTEVLLIGSSEDPKAELGIELEPEPENEWTADVFRDLRMEKSRHPAELQFTGEWR